MWTSWKNSEGYYKIINMKLPNQKLDMKAYAFGVDDFIKKSESFEVEQSFHIAIAIIIKKLCKNSMIQLVQANLPLHTVDDFCQQKFVASWKLLFSLSSACASCTKNNK